jgi:hypothetical protein
MKKYIIKTGFIFFAAALFYSCNDDFLERYPLDVVSNTTFWRSESDLKVYNNSLYNLAINGNSISFWLVSNNNGYQRSAWWNDNYSDNQASTNVGLGPNILLKRAGKHPVPSSIEWFGYGGWNFVRACNVGLANYEKAEIDQSIINKYIAEARLFRGWFYFDKVKRYGDVPWLDRELNVNSEELYADRTPREEVMTNILADLDFACENLPNSWGDGNAPGRLNRWAALLVKSKCCLFEGTWRKYHGGTNPDQWLQEAADAAQELIEDGPYSLYSTGDPLHDYKKFHAVPDLSGNSEILYWVKYQLGVLINNQMTTTTRLAGGATRNLVEDFLCTDGLPITLSPLYKGDAVYEDIFENRDPRLRQTVLHPADQEYYFYGKSYQYEYPRLPGMVGGHNTIPTGYHIIKYYNADLYEDAWNVGVTPCIIIRFGEALLNFAEAKAELGTLTQADLDISINKLRDRVGMIHMDLANIPVDPRYSSDGISPLLVEIRRERRIELCFEGFRYDDLRRWKQGKKLENRSLGMRWDDAAKAKYDLDGKVTSKTSTDPITGIPYIDPYKGTTWDNPVFDESKHYLWPIQLSAISQNPNITQNPGWE